MKNPLVSVIIVNFNGAKFLDSCLSSLKEQTYPNFEVIVVDNGSTDSSLKILEEGYRGFVTVIKNEINFGFSKGNNIGISQANGEFVAILNNDTQADARWLEELISAAQTDKNTGMCATKVLFFCERDTIDSAGVNIFWDGMSRGRGRLKKDIGQYDGDREVLLPSGCAALYRKSMLQETGLFDEDFVAYCEDTDLGLRGRLAGYKCAFAPLAVVYHHYSGTAGRYSSFKAFMVERNHFWVALKIFPAPLLLLLPFFTVYRLAMQVLSLFGYLSKKGNNKEERFPIL
ncbi:MAG: glycosyltransferase family 2 protein, partial [Candidatus Omnitrophota bacterium]